MTLFLSLIIHKGIEAFSVGLQVTRANTTRKVLVITTIIAYALMTPIGSMLGVLLTVSVSSKIFFVYIGSAILFRMST